MRRFYYIFIILLFACNKQPDQHNGHDKHSQNYSHVADSSLHILTSQPNQTVFTKSELVRPKLINAQQPLTLNGYVAFDERRNLTVSSRVSGRIEKLYARFENQFIKKGDKVLELYSPEVSAIQEEYLYHLKNNNGEELNSAKQKLILLGMSQSQIQQLHKEQQVLRTIAIYSPATGYIRFSTQSSSTQNQTLPNSNSMSEMNGPAQSGMNTQASSGNKILEGDYVSKGEKLFNINDASTLAAIISIPQQISSLIKLKDKINLNVNNIEITATADLFETTFGNNQKYLQLRSYVDNSSKKLSANQPVKASVFVSGQWLMIPKTSIITTGNRSYVWRFIKDVNKVHVVTASEINTGPELEDNIVITAGIHDRDQIVKDAGYLLDSESLLNPEPK